MLLSWSDALRVGLCPDRLILARIKRGLRPRVVDKKILDSHVLGVEQKLFNIFTRFPRVQ